MPDRNPRKPIHCMVLAILLVLVFSPAVQASPDLDGHWARRDIDMLTAHGVLEVEADAMFRPDEPITRAEIVAMLLSGLHPAPLASTSGDGAMAFPSDVFTDVEAGHWFEAYAYAAADEDLVTGYPDGRFEPGGSLTRAELVTMLHRSFDSPEAGVDLEFADAGDIPDWAEDGAAWADGLGFVVGFPDGTFRPSSLTTRAEAVTILRRAMAYRGVLYDLRGRVTGRSMDGSSLEVRLDDGNRASIDVGIIPVYRAGQRIHRREISRGEKVGVLFDDAGDVAWIDVLPGSILGIVDGMDFPQDRIRVTPWEPDDRGSLSSWERMAFWSAAGRPDAGGESATSLDLYWTDDTVFYRQGIEVSPAFLRPGDRVYLHLGSDGPVVEFVDAVRYDAWGEVLAIEEDGRRLEWAGLGAEHTGRMTPNTRIEYAGRRIERDRLSPGDRVGVVYARDGEEILYVEVYDGSIPDRVGVASAERGEDPLPREPGEVSNAELLGIGELRERLDVTGEGVRVAVVDTGIDPGIQALWGGDGPTLVDWKDFTGSGSLRQRIAGAPASRAAEGDVYFRQTVDVSERDFNFEGRDYRITGRLPADGTLRVGWLYPEALGVEEGRSLLVAAGRSQDEGDYDRVYVDTDGDGVLRSAETYRPVTDGGKPGTLYPAGPEGPAIHFVVAELDRHGDGVTLGYDANGHGTKVASVIGSAAADAGEGLAPGVHLMALKALDSKGSGTWEEVLRAVRYAAEQGADIINISVTGAQDLSAGGSRESRELHEIVERYDVLIVTAVGNAGPGLATAFTPGDVRSTLAVGAASLPEVVARDYGYALSETGVWQHSSVGPRADGALAPAVLAPASAHVTPAGHLGSGEPMFFEGTSCAAAHVTGLAALLVEAARGQGLDFSMTGVKRALETGAQHLPGYLAVEQGYGLIDPEASWAALRRDPTGRYPFSLSVDSAIMVERPYSGDEPGGIYLRSMAPGSLSTILRNPSDTVQTVRFETEDLPSARVPSTPVTVPGKGEVRVPLEYDAIPEGTAESGFIVARSTEDPGVESRLLHTLVNPVALGPDREGLGATGTLGPGSSDRKFVKVPDGASRLSVDLANPGGDTGRVSVQLVDPDGVPAYLSPYVGVGSHDRHGPVDEISHTIHRPRPGVWEVNVSSSPSLSFYGLEESLYRMHASVAGDRSILLDPEKTEWRFLPGEVPDFSDVRVDLHTGQDAALEELEAYAHGWFSTDISTRILGRKWVDHRPGEAYYEEVRVEEGTARLEAWAGNPDDGSSGDIEVYIYGYDAYDNAILKAEGEGSAGVTSPSAGRYLVVARSQSRDAVRFELAADAWPVTRDIRVHRVSTTPGSARLLVRAAAPEMSGQFRAVVGLRHPERGVVAETTLRAEVGTSAVLISANRVGNSDEMVVSARQRDGEVAAGVLRLDDRIYALDASGRAYLPAGDDETARRWMGSLRYGSPEGEWTAPIDLVVPRFTREELLRWRGTAAVPLSRGAWSSPLAPRRLSGFLGAF